MRIYLKLTPNTKPVDFSYQEKLVGTLHKWLGVNNIHDNMSIYSFSWLEGGKAKNGVLEFANGANWFISFWETKLLKTIVGSIRNDPKVAFGMEVNEIIIRENPEFGTNHKFDLASPVLIKRMIDNNEKHFIYSDVESANLLEETIMHKMKIAGIEDKEIRISFDMSYPNPKTKLLTYKGIGNRASMCPVILEGDPVAIQFAWNVGIGNSTGIGFGALK